MKWFAPKSLRRLLFAAICLGGMAGSEAHAAKEKEKNAKEAKTAPGGINLPIAIGHEAKGVKLPYIDAEGRLQMNFSMGNVRRLDETHLKMGNLVIETYDDAGKADMTFDLPASIYDTVTRIIISDDPVKIRRSDFELTGESMQFNTTTRQGVLRGQVRMLIFNRDEVAAPSKTP